MSTRPFVPGPAALALLCALAISCTDEPLRPSEMSASDVATTFAEALISDDFDTARELVCSDTPDPEGQGSFPFEGAEIVGAPSPEVPPNTFVEVSGDGPLPDFYVSFKATDEGEGVDGSVEITFGQVGCVMVYAVNRASAVDD